MARSSNTVERRRDIAHALLELMAQRGYDGASIADIAAGARLTPGLVHYHFDSKHEILLAAVHELGQKHLTALDQTLARAHAAPAKLDAFIDFHLKAGKAAKPAELASWLVIGAEAVRDASVRVPYQSVLGELCSRLEQIITQGNDVGVFRCRRVHASAVAILAAIQGYFAIAGAARALIPRRSAATQVKAMSRGLLAERSAS